MIHVTHVLTHQEAKRNRKRDHYHVNVYDEQRESQRVERERRKKREREGVVKAVKRKKSLIRK